MTPLSVLVALLGLWLPAGPADDSPTPPPRASVRALPGVVASPRPAALTPAPPPAPRSAGVWPLRPRPAVVHGFDPPSSPFGSGHRGVDLLGAPGQQVHAALAGTVRYAGLLAGVGVVVVDHGATRTTYQPVTASVAVGTPVARGAVLGTLDPVGSHCAPASCLHWGWIRNADDVYLDPLLLVGAGPVRLLPLDP